MNLIKPLFASLFTVIAMLLLHFLLVNYLFPVEVSMIKRIAHGNLLTSINGIAFFILSILLIFGNIIAGKVVSFIWGILGALILRYLRSYQHSKLLLYTSILSSFCLMADTIIHFWKFIVPILIEETHVFWTPFSFVYLISLSIAIDIMYWQTCGWGLYASLIPERKLPVNLHMFNNLED